MTLFVGDLLEDAAAVRPAGLAATLGEQSVRYGDLDASANRLANCLHALGVETGQTVAWWSGPTLDSIAGFAAVARLGAVFAPLNPALGTAEAGEALRYLHPRLLVADGDLAGPARDLAGPLGLLVWSIDDLLDAARQSSSAQPGRPAISDADPHIVYLTSGTTGRPKGVVVSHRASWLRSFPGASTFATGLRGDGGILPSFPLFHYGGWHYVLEAWHHRCAFHLCHRFDGPTLVDAAARWRPTGMYCIPAVWSRVLEASPAGDELASVRHADTGTSAAPLELLIRLRERMPEATTSVLYGSSEGGHHTTLTDRDITRKPGSVGRVAPPGVIRISDAGEVLYRSPTLMMGYFEMAAETESALEGGWYHTGDLGIFDDDGYLYITGRAREVIRTGGEAVAPPEVEAALAGLAGVSEIAVIGLPDEKWGEIVCAVLVVAPGRVAGEPHDVEPNAAEPLTVDTVRRHLADRLAPFKHPRRIAIVESIPRTAATGQVQRTLLREQILAQEPTG